MILFDNRITMRKVYAGLSVAGQKFQSQFFSLRASILPPLLISIAYVNLGFGFIDVKTNKF